MHAVRNELARKMQFANVGRGSVGPTWGCDRVRGQ